jgi:DNA modification methylase
MDNMKNTTNYEFPQLNYSKVKVLLLETVFPAQEDIKTNKKLILPFIESLNSFLKSIKENAKKGFLLYVYGLPSVLPLYHEIITNYMEFKYWIAMKAATYDFKKLPNSHMGLLLYSVDGSIPLNTKDSRIEYLACSYCGKNISDWGGKKHLMNKIGTSISDVWSDFYPRINTKPDPQVEDITLHFIDVTKNTYRVSDNKLNDLALERIQSLSECSENEISIVNLPESLNIYTSSDDIAVSEQVHSLDVSPLQNKVFLGDSIELMKDWIKIYPNGVFDLIFADPPYNLDKDYKKYADSVADTEYIQWCNKWLDLSAQLLKEGGSIFILNIPKWALDHFTQLSSRLQFQNWIVWDSMSTPKGKIMPAHYSLLHFSKGNKYTYNKLEAIEARDACSRASCYNKRKHVSTKTHIDDIWSDIHRIKHVKYKNDHPCHLPQKLMERIVLMFSNEHDLIFDPFSGVGTTAMVSHKNNRNYTTVDISDEYVELSKMNIDQGFVENDKARSRPIKKAGITKKKVELFVQDLTIKEKRRITDVNYLIEKINLQRLVDDEFNIDDILKLYDGDLTKPLKASRIQMLNKKDN